MTPRATDPYALRARAAGLRATRTTLQLLRTLARQRRPVGVATLRQALVPTPAHTTVYRLLERLVRAGVVTRVDLQHGHADYELSRRDAHHHATCVRCGHVVRLPGCVLAPSLRSLASAAGLSEVSHHTFELYGTCRRCAGGQRRGYVS